FLQRGMELITGIVNKRTKHVAGNILSVDANKDGLVSAIVDVAHHHRQMNVAVDYVFISYCAKEAMDSRKISFHDPAHERFFTNAIANKVRDGDHFEIVLRGKFLQLRQTRHRSIFIHDLADDAGRIKSGKTRNVHARFGLTRSNEYASGLGAQ